MLVAKDLVGKTTKSVYLDECYLCIIFEDGSYIELESKSNSDDNTDSNWLCVDMGEEVHASKKKV